jgi:hypothetical protein
MSQENQKNWNLLSCVVALGLTSFGGAGEDGFLEATPGGPKFSSVKGNDGTIVRYYTGETLWKISIKLLITSSTNDFLSSLLNADVTASRQGLNGAGVVPFLLETLNGSMLLASPRTWITGPPEKIEIQSKPTTLEWMLEAADCIEFIGGTKL